jgi:hypothetical protein
MLLNTKGWCVMTDDIVTRLRELPNKNYTEHGVVVSLEDCLKIADEIEKLRKELSIYKDLYAREAVERAEKNG